jgi:hypothetical protein
MRQQAPTDPVSLPSDQPARAPTTPLPVSDELPSWESFTRSDRQRLVQLLVQTARRQAPRRWGDGPLVQGG